MSRSAPFPTNSSRKPRSPSLSNGSSQVVMPFPSEVRPLQINRPTTPSNSSMSTSPRASGPLNGPSRPMRSELRQRQTSEYSSYDRSSSSRLDSDDRPRDSSSTARSDVSPVLRARNGSTSTVGSTMHSRARPERSATGDSAASIEPDSATSTRSLATVMSAFQAAGARKRAMTNGSEDMEYERERAKQMEMERLRQQRIKEKVPGRKATGKPRAGDIDGMDTPLDWCSSGRGERECRVVLTSVLAVLDQINDEWGMMIDPDFNSIDLALKLLDESSFDRDVNSFRRTKDILTRALKGSVDKHYQAFAAALPHHADLLNHLTVAQSQVSTARNTLSDAKDALGTKRADLVQLWSRGQMVEEMIRLLDEIEHLKAVPDILETLMSEKRLLQAAVVLVRSLKMINKQEMHEIGAVADLRSHLQGQEIALRDLLIDELHAHLFLKSFWCESRWAAYTANQQTFPIVPFEEDTLQFSASGPLSPPSPTSPTSSRGRLTRFLTELSVRPNESSHELDESNIRHSATGQNLSSSMSGATPIPSLNSLNNLTMTSLASQNGRNPESDSFTYMETLLEALAVLGKLGNALDVVAQRLPAEIYVLIETTLDEVEERSEYRKRTSSLAAPGTVMAKSNGRPISTWETVGGASGTGFSMVISTQAGLLSSSSLRLAALESSSQRADQETLRDLFWTLYSKLDSVAQGLRLVYEVSNRIGSRRDFKDASGTKPGALFPLAEIWMPIQTQVQTLLQDCLTDEEQGAVSGRNPISSINEVLREGKFTRDKSKPMFRFGDADLKRMYKTLKPHEDELTQVLKSTMPGLVQGATENMSQVTLYSASADDRIAGPTLQFLDRVTEIIPSGAETARSSNLSLDDFVAKVYLPQLEEKVLTLFQSTASGPDSFQPDASSTRYSTQPLTKATIQLMALVNSLCAMLQQTPFHRENYSRLILAVIIQFYQRCSDRFQDLVSFQGPGNQDASPRIVLAAEWAQRPELNTCLTELLSSMQETDFAKTHRLHGQEMHLEINLLGRNSIAKFDLISNIRSLASLSNLYSSVTWFVKQLNELKSVPDESLSPTSPLRLEPPTAASPLFQALPASGEAITLPLSKEMALRFQALLKTYDQLGQLVLHTLRMDVRCRVTHYLESAMRHGNYFIDHEAGEPDPHIIDLNAELNKCDELISSALPLRERQFVFVGLGQLIEQLLISNARHLRIVNQFGIKKIMRNMLALQQSIRTIINEIEDSDFRAAKSYYSLFFTSPQDMLDSIRQKRNFSFDEYKVMLNLQCGVDSAAGEAGVARGRDRNYTMYVIDLHGIELETSSEEDAIT